MNLDQKYALEVVEAVNANTREHHERSEPDEEASKAEWAHEFGLVCEKHNLTKGQMRRVANLLPWATERLRKRLAR